MSFYLMHRGWRDHHLFRDQPYSDGEAWEHLIATANFSPTKYRQASKLYDIPRGDLATSYRSLGEKWKWSTNKVIRFLKLLQCDTMIEIKNTKKTEHNFLQITVVNYEAYQNPSQEKETEKKQQRNSDGDRKKTETNTNVKNYNKDKELNNIDTFKIFFLAYPSVNRPKGSKKKALAAYQSALNKTDHETIMNGVNAYASHLRNSGQSSADTHRWLQDERWGDDYTFSVGNPSENARGESKISRLQRAAETARAQREQREQGQAGRSVDGVFHVAENLWQGA